MGIQQLVKGTFRSIGKNNSVNARAVRELDRRVTDIAAELERSPNPEKEQHLKRIVNTLSEGFTVDPATDDASSRLAPVYFMKRQELIFTADSELDKIKPPTPNRKDTLKAATMKDYNGVKYDIDKLTNTATASLQELIKILPARGGGSNPEAAKVLEEVTAGQSDIHKLQSAMVQFSERIERLQEQGIMDKNLSVIIYKLEEPESDPEVHLIPTSMTFGELSDHITSTANEEEDVIVPDFWIKKIDPTRNCITKTKHWYQYQNPNVRVREAFPEDVNSGANPPCKLQLVTKDGEYVVALVDDNGMEKMKTVDMIAKRRKAREHFKTIFKDRKVVKILKLADGSDISESWFTRNVVTPRTNSLYVQLEVPGNAEADASPLAVACEIPGSEKGKGKALSLDSQLPTPAPTPTGSLSKPQPGRQGALI